MKRAGAERPCDARARCPCHLYASAMEQAVKAAEESYMAGDTVAAGDRSSTALAAIRKSAAQHAGVMAQLFGQASTQAVTRQRIRLPEGTGTRIGKCIVCMGYIKQADQQYTCSCGKPYHLPCINRVENCVGCGKPFREQ